MRPESRVRPGSRLQCPRPAAKRYDNWYISRRRSFVAGGAIRDHLHGQKVMRAVAAMPVEQVIERSGGIRRPDKRPRNERQASAVAQRGEIPATMQELLQHAAELERSAASHQGAVPCLVS
jgi:hypothetical protein